MHPESCRQDSLYPFQMTAENIEDRLARFSRGLYPNVESHNRSAHPLGCVGSVSVVSFFKLLIDPVSVGVMLQGIYFCVEDVRNMTEIDIGISAGDRSVIAEELKRLLADTYTLYLQTHNFHWNVTGPQFRELHLMFEEQYTELATAVDDLAERIRTLGEPAPGTYKAFAKLSSISEVEGVPSASEMVGLLNQGHEQVVKTCRKALRPAQDAGDESSAALISDRMRIHEKTAWMLRAMS